MNLIKELEEFIKTTKDGREMKRAIAVKMKVQGKKNREIQLLLCCSQSFISKWKNQVIFGGIEQLKIQYKGSKSYLSLSQKAEVVQWLQSLKHCEREKLQLRQITE